ncbi:hypothetical protein MRX96_002413 [Rhipicephalus microplus]
MQELFNPTHDESTSAVNGDPDEPHQPSEEDHWQITRIALERALPRISASTATGLDGIPAGLVKCLGKSAREHLAGIFNTILKNGPIPPDWQCGRVSLVCKRGGDAGLLGDYRPITLDQRQMPSVWTDFFRRLYADSSVVACFRGTRTQPVRVTRGLRQGCPLSPLLYRIYVAGLEQALVESGVGFAFRLMIGGVAQTWTLPGLVFADDLVLLAERSSDLQSYRRGREGYSAEVQEIVPEEDATSVISILAVRTDKSTGVYVDVNVASVTATTRVHTMNFLVDTGSAVSIMGLGADPVDEPEVVHQPEEQPVPLCRSTRERRPPERLGDYVQ